MLKAVVHRFGTGKEWDNHIVKSLFCYFCITSPIPRDNKTQRPTPNTNKFWEILY